MSGRYRSRTVTRVPGLDIEELRPVQRRLDIDADLARLDRRRLPELEEAFVKLPPRGRKHNEITAVALREVGVPA